MATFVLVHGAFQGGWVYARVARILRQAGHDVYTPTLTGLGERSHLAGNAINLDTHVQDIVNVFRFEGIHDVILCGHSYGGLVITGVAGKIAKRITSLIYLDAYAPAEGESLLEISGPEMSLAVLEQAAQNAGMIPPIPAAAFNVNKADITWVDSMCGPQPLPTFVQRSRYDAEAVSVAHRTYIYATENGGNWFQSTYARLRDKTNWKIHTIASGHNVMLDHPDKLATLLLEELCADL